MAVIFQTPASPQISAASGERRFFLFLTILMMLTVGICESFRFFLVGYYHPPDFHTPELYIHVMVVASWLLLYQLLALLDWAGWRGPIRILGRAGMFLALMMLIMGLVATADMLHRKPETAAHAIVPVTQILFFSIFVTLSWRDRRNAEAHRRWMILAMIDPMYGVLYYPLLPYLRGAAEIVSASWILLLLLAAWDWWRWKKLHPATLWGGLVLILVEDTRNVLGTTAAWQTIAHWIQSWPT